MGVTRDVDGFLIPQEPMYLFWTERDTESAKKYGPSYPQPDIWACREHPDWNGEDVPTYPSIPDDFPLGEDEEPIQAHAARHGLSVEPPATRR